MKEGPNPLLPLLRSRLQAEVLAAVLLDPDREWSLTELAELVGASVATVQREIKRAEGAGVVRSRKQGNTRLVRADPDGDLTAPLAELLLRSFGPRHVLADALRDVPGIDAAYLFGSWAARYEGERGPAPHDIDVLVIGQPDRDALDGATSAAERRLARRVDVTVRRRSWWDNGDDSFRKEVASRPMVEIVAAGDATETS
ncbi:MAG: ArsR family transcriptional regulator [Actinomycetota bacterium]